MSKITNKAFYIELQLNNQLTTGLKDEAFKQCEKIYPDKNQT